MSSKVIGRIGMGMVASMILVAIFAPLIAPYDPFAMVGTPFQAPCGEFWLGTNDVGQDIFSELVYGTRTSLLVGILSALICMLIGVTIGICAGWFGGWADRFLMKITTFFITIPYLPAIIILAAFTRSGVWTTAVILGVMSWPGLARVIRSQTMQIKTKDYILTVRAMGASSFYILTRHILRELFPFLMYRVSDRIKSGILSESSLSFLGLGDPVSKSWGSIIYYAQSKSALLTGSWVWWIIPAGACICFVCFGLIMISYYTESKTDSRVE